MEIREVLLENSCSKFSKYKEDYLQLQQNPQFFLYFISNENIFTHLATLVCISSYKCATILTSLQQNFENFRSEETFLHFGGRMNKMGDRRQNLQKWQEEQKGGGEQHFLKKIEGGPTYEDAVTWNFQICFLELFLILSLSVCISIYEFNKAFSFHWN